MAQGRNSLKFIALMARLGWDDEAIHIMYKHALRNGALCSHKKETWLRSAKWYKEEYLGNRSSQ